MPSSRGAGRSTRKHPARATVGLTLATISVRQRGCWLLVAGGGPCFLVAEALFGFPDMASCSRPHPSPQSGPTHFHFFSLYHPVTSNPLPIPSLPSLPHSFPPNTRDLFKFTPHLHNTKSQHPRIQPQRLPHRMLRLTPSVKPQDEILALVVQGTAGFADGFGKEEGSPVGDAADNAAGAEDEGASGFGYSVGV